VKKKVLFLFHDSNPLSGATASMLEVVTRLNTNAGYEVIALIPNTKFGLHDALDSQGIKYFEDTIYGVRHDRSKANILTKKLKSFLAIVLNFCIAIKLAIRKGKFDLIYTNTSDIYIGVFLSKLTGVKHIWHIREFGIEDQNMTHFFGERSFYKFLNLTSSKVIVISNALKNKLNSFSVSESKIEMIYNDVTNKAEVDNKINNEKGELSLLIVGSIIDGKGHKFVIDCIAYMKSININVKLGIVGRDSGDYAVYLKRYMKQVGCDDKVDFLGYSSDVGNIRKDYDIAVVASKSEAFGRVTIEAMHSKMTVVASDCGANPELIENGKNGFLFEYGNIEEFARIISTLDKKRCLLEATGTQAHKDSSKFSSGQASNKINQTICNTLY
jgi:glycosyltransferase involved in cell wall biosynthesis